MAELNIGTKVKDRYTLKEFKGSGSFGEVWLAHDEILDCDVALKIYISLDSRGVEEFQSEYVITQGISHPNLLTTNYFDVWEQRPFLVMKYCAKGSSSQLVGKISERALWQFIHDVSAGLKYLHSMPEPIIHQDIKPDNILVDETGRYLITDFGISKKVRSTMRKQSKRAVGAGAVAYMGPERFESNPMAVRASDIWSLGASIYELATGELPFSGLGGGMQRSGAVIPALDDKWSKEMTMIMQSCLARETWDRPTAKQLEAYSEAVINGEPAVVTWGLSEEKDSSHQMSQQGVDNTKEKQTDLQIRVWIAISAAAIVVLLMIFSWPSKKADVPAAAPNTATQADTYLMKSDDCETQPNSQGNETVGEEDFVKIDSETTTTDEAEKSKYGQNTDEARNGDAENAILLKKALANKDYKTIKYLANECGYVPSFVPFAKYCLQKKDYETAEIFASAAAANGSPATVKEAMKILEALKSLGYFD